MRKLAFLIVLLSVLSFGQTHTFPATDTNNVFTGTNTFTLTTTFGNVVINGTCTGAGCASGGGSGYATIKNASVAITQRTILNILGALVCADNAGTLASDCKLATNTAVANQYLTGIDSSGNFLRKQIAYGELSGTPQLAVTKTAVTSNWIRSYDSTTGLFTASQPAYTDITGTPTLPATLANAAHKWLNSYSSGTGLFTQTQPDYTDLTSLPQLAITKAAVASNWIRSYDSTTGLFTASQPAYSDISGTVPAVASIATTGPITGGTITTTGTIACATCVTSSAPGAGVAHFAGSTQAVTSSAVTSADTTGTFPATAHNLLSATHGDTVAASPVMGDLIYGNVTPAWTKLAGATQAGGGGFVNETQAVLAVPTAPTLTVSATGGTITQASGTTVFVRVTLVNAFGETTGSTETSIAVNTTNGCTAAATTCSVNVPAVTLTGNATGYTVYDSVVAGMEQQQTALAACVNKASGVCVIGTLGTGAAPPLYNSAANGTPVVPTWKASTGTGSVVLQTAAVENPQSTGGILYAAQFAATSTTCGIAEAYAALPSNGGKIILQNGNCSAAGWPVLINSKPVVIEGQGMGGPIDAGFNANVVAGSSLTNTSTGGSFFVITIPGSVGVSHEGATFRDFAMIGNKTVGGATAGDCVDMLGGTSTEQIRAISFTNIQCNQPKGFGFMMQDNAFIITFYNVHVDQSGSHCMVLQNGPNGGIPSQIHVIASVLDLCGGNNASFLPGTADGINISGTSARSIDITDSTMADSNNGINVVAGATNASIHVLSSDFESNTTCDISLNDGLVHRISSSTLFGGGTFGLHGICTAMPAGAPAQQNQLFVDGNWFGSHTSQDIIIGANQKTGFILPQNSNIYTYLDSSANVIKLDVTTFAGLNFTGNFFSPGANGTGSFGQAGAFWSSLFVFNTHLSESTAPAGVAAQDVCYGDSTAHAMECNYNNTGFGIVPLLNRANNWTGVQTFTAAPVPNAAGAPAIGTAALPWGSLFIGTAATNNANLLPDTMTAARTIRLPDAPAGLTEPAFVTANVTNSTTTMANATGLTWPLVASRNYRLSCDLIYQAASTGGLQLAFTGPASPTQAMYCIHADVSATTIGDGTACTPAANASFATKVGAGVVGTATTNFPARFTGVIENGVNAGALQIQFASAAAVATTIERGSVCTLQAIN